MYLFVFIFVMMSVLGLYTELFSLRMAQVTKNQRAVAETMMLWHGAAVYFAKDKINGWGAIPATGCSVTDAATTCGALLMSEANKYLPTGYANDAQIQFDTLVFSSGSSRYLLTYVVPGDVRLGFTHTQIQQQMAKANLPDFTYGYVSTTTCEGHGAGTWLVTKAYLNATQVCYDIPLNGGAPIVPVGTVGIISAI